MTHSSSLPLLDALLSSTAESKWFASVVPQYKHEAARMLIGLHASLAIECAIQLHILYLDRYGEGLTPEEQDSLNMSATFCRTLGSSQSLPMTQLYC